MHQLRGHAWNDLAKTLSVLGRNDEALPLFAKAEKILEKDVLAHDRAIVRLNLSIAYQEIGRYGEAVTLLEDTKRIFHDYGDTNLYVVAGFYQGMLLHRLRRYREARETHVLLLAESPNMDRETLAAVHNSIGNASLELGEYLVAEANLTRAVQLYTELDHSLDVVKTQLALGRILLRQGEYQKALEHLRPIRLHFLKHSLAEEAGICGLDIVEALLGLRKPEEAETLARTVMNEFLAAKLNDRAVTALGYLANFIASEKALPRTATLVRNYVLSLRTAPEREFPIVQLWD
jgi:tetratricopeptide (TPR) repeat protein